MSDDEERPAAQTPAELHLARLDEIIDTAVAIARAPEPSDTARVKALSVAEHALSQKAAILGLYRHD